jgi:hypothetical protein
MGPAAPTGASPRPPAYRIRNRCPWRSPLPKTLAVEDGDDHGGYRDCLRGQAITRPSRLAAAPSNPAKTGVLVTTLDLLNLFCLAIISGGLGAIALAVLL